MPVSNGSAHKYLTLKHLIRKQKYRQGIKTHDERLMGFMLVFGWVMELSTKMGITTLSKICTNSDDVNPK